MIVVACSPMAGLELLFEGSSEGWWSEKT